MSFTEAIRDRLQAHIDELRVIDTHEHLPMEADRPKDTDVLAEWLTHYFSCDLVSAGLSDEQLEFARNASNPLARRWKTVEPYWGAARSTGYGRALDIAAEGIYGIDGVCAKTIGPLNEAFQAARAKGGHYQRVLKDRSRIALSIVDSNLDCDRKFFASVFRLDDFLCAVHRRDVTRLGREVDVRVHSLDDYKEAMRLHMDKGLARGAVALKCSLAYKRTLHFEKADLRQADADFNELFRQEMLPPNGPERTLSKPLQDHLMHHMMSLADERGLTVQFHTGIQEGNGNLIRNSNPVSMTNLFMEYENVTFDIFHMGYPYCMELSNLAKNFRNVYIDMCWGHIISPEAARRALAEWLDAVPANKISAFGGDYCFVDGVYGHQVLARKNVTASLTQKVVDGSFDVDRAKQIAQWVLVDNPTKLFHLSARVKAASKTAKSSKAACRRK